MNGRPISAPQALSDACDAEVDLAGINTLHVCFRASVPHLHAARGTLCWRQGSPALPMTGVIGHAAAQGTPLHAVGLLQPVEMLELAGADNALADAAVALAAALEDGACRVSVRLYLHGEAPAHATMTIRHADGVVRAPLSRGGATLAGEVRVEHPRLWWPHTHGKPARYRVLAETGGHVLDCGQIGLRSVRLDQHGRNAFARINDVPVFCRGARVGAGELAALVASPLAARRWMRLARGAGMNVLYLDRDCAPAADIRLACDALGMLLWREGMDLPVAAGLPDMAGVPAHARSTRLACRGPWAIHAGRPVYRVHRVRFGMPRTCATAACRRCMVWIRRTCAASIRCVICACRERSPRTW